MPDAIVQILLYIALFLPLESAEELLGLKLGRAHVREVLSEIWSIQAEEFATVRVVRGKSCVV